MPAFWSIIDFLKRPRDATPVVLITLLALLVRMPGLGSLPIWYDEALSYWSATRSWHDLWIVVPRFETHSVLFYSLLKLWLPVGESEFILRLLSVILDLLVIPLVYVSGMRVCGRRCAFLAALLFACAPFQIMHSQNIRPYTLLTLASALVVYFAVQILCRIVEPNSGKKNDPEKMVLPYLGLALSGGLLLWAHNLGALQLAVIFVFFGVMWLLGRISRPILSRIFLAAVGAGVLYLPNLLVLAYQFNGVRKGWWLWQPSVGGLLVGSTEILGFPVYNLGILPIALMNAAVVAAILMGIAALVEHKKADDAKRRWCLLLLGSAAIGPWLIAVVITYSFVPVFLTRALIICQVPALLFLAVMITSIGRIPSRIAHLAYPFFIILIFSNLILFYGSDLRSKEPERQSKRIVTDLLKSRSGSAPVFVISNSAALSLAYYGEQAGVSLNLVPIPAPYPAPGFAKYPDGSRGIPGIEPQHVKIVDEHLGTANRAWLIRRGANLYDANNIVENFLDKKFPCKAIRIGSDNKLELAEIAYYDSKSKTCGDGIATR